MPRPFNHRGNVSDKTSHNLEHVIRSARNQWNNWNNQTQQTVFNHAIELIRRPNKTQNQDRLAKQALEYLVIFSGRTWNNHPASIGFVSNSGSNNQGQVNTPSTNNSKVRKFAERWRLKGPVKLVNLPTNENNRKDPVSLHMFHAGQEAIQHQRRNAAGRVISTRYYLVPTIERLAGMKWNAIRRMHPNKVLVKESGGPGNKFLATTHIPNVITRLPMYRRNLTLVKFKA
jgi:hypothetical protein